MKKKTIIVITAIVAVLIAGAIIIALTANGKKNKEDEPKATPTETASSTVAPESTTAASEIPTATPAPTIDPIENGDIAEDEVNEDNTVEVIEEEIEEIHKDPELPAVASEIPAEKTATATQTPKPQAKETSEATVTEKPTPTPTADPKNPNAPVYVDQGDEEHPMNPPIDMGGSVQDGADYYGEDLPGEGIHF